MELNKRRIGDMERNIAPPLRLAITIPVEGTDVVIYVGITNFRPENSDQEKQVLDVATNLHIKVGVDYHLKTAIELSGLTRESFLGLPPEIQHEWRGKAKVFNFRRLYGNSGAVVREKAELTVEEEEQLCSKFEDTDPGLHKLQAELQLLLKERTDVVPRKP